MTLFIITVFIACGLSFFLFLARRFLAARARVLRNAATPFECGFDPKRSARTPFSLRFFLLAIIFLIFDVEVVILFPVVIIIRESQVVVAVGGVLLFLLVLLIGLFHE